MFSNLNLNFLIANDGFLKINLMNFLIANDGFLKIGNDEFCIRNEQAGEALYAQGDRSTGMYYMLLRGSCKQETPQARVKKDYKHLRVPDTWGDSSMSLAPDTGKEVDMAQFQVRFQ